MTWETFIYFAIPSVILWAAGAYFAFRDKRKLALTLPLPAFWSLLLTLPVYGFR